MHRIDRANSQEMECTNMLNAQTFFMPPDDFQSNFSISNPFRWSTTETYSCFSLDMCGTSEGVALLSAEFNPYILQKYLGLMHFTRSKVVLAPGLFERMFVKTALEYLWGLIAVLSVSSFRFISTIPLAILSTTPAFKSAESTKATSWMLPSFGLTSGTILFLWKINSVHFAWTGFGF